MLVGINLLSISISFSWTGASSSCSSISVCKLRRLVEEDFVVITLLLLLLKLLPSPLPGRGTSGTASVSSPRASTLRRLDKSTCRESHLALALFSRQVPRLTCF